MSVKTYINPDFKVMDEHREWSLKKDWPMYLPDTFIHSFKEHFDQKREDKDSKGKHANWHATFKRWIRQSCPTGDFYNPGLWERRLNEAKEIESSKFKRTAPEPYYDAGLRKTPMPDSTREIVERMRELRQKP